MPKLTTPQGSPGNKTYKMAIDKFQGVDLSNAPGNVDPRRSPNAKNMVPDFAGRPVKRTGYFEKAAFAGGAVNGVFYLEIVSRAEEPAQVWEVAHVGTNLYDVGSGDLLFGDMNDAKSTAFQVDATLYILDGKTFMQVRFDQAGGLVAEKVEDHAYIPTVCIARSPNGKKGTPYEQPNLLTRWWTDSFLGEVAELDYHLSYRGLESSWDTIVEVMQPDGTFTRLTVVLDYNVNRERGLIRFATPPGVSPIPGVDNVRISTKQAPMPEDAEDESLYIQKEDILNKCRFGILFGVGGTSDRLFLSGNPKYPNRDWYSAMGDPTYFGEYQYAQLGEENAPITGYSILGDKLATHKTGAENAQNIILRQGQLVDGQAAFVITSTLQGEGAISTFGFGYLAEPMFLTRRGVYAVTAQDLTGDKYTQNRSFYINKQLCAEVEELLREENSRVLTGVSTTVFQNFYLLAIAGKVYLLDTSQKNYEANEPYSTYQYECYHWDNIDAKVIWSRDNVLYFGTGDGRILEFYTDYGSAASYSDDGQPIEAWWETPELSGNSFYKNMSIHRLGLRLNTHPETSVRVQANVRGIWRDVFEETAKTRSQSFSDTSFGDFTFATDQTPRTIQKKPRLRKLDKVQFRLLNDKLEEPFGLCEFAAEFGENGYYKR